MRLSNHCYCLTGLTHADLFSVNAGFIVGHNETIIVDSGFNTECAQTILGYAEAVAPNNKVSYVVNLEGHYDHILGNSYLREKGIKSIAHELVAISEKEINAYIEECNNEITIDRRKLNKEAYIYFKDVKDFNVDIKVSKDMNIDIDGLSLKIYLAYGHTNTNLILYEEQDKVLYAADTIYSEYLPTFAFGDKELWNKWLETLDLIQSLNPNIIVPGHGPIIKGNDIEKELLRHRKLILDRIKMI